MKFESFIAISLPVKTLKFQPNWLTGGRAIGCVIGQTRRKTAKIIDFSQFLRPYSCMPCRTQTKFESSIAILLPVHLLKFQPNWTTGDRAIGRGIGQPLSGHNHFSPLGATRDPQGVPRGLKVTKNEF